MNVYESARKRIEYLFDNFDNIYVSFSGGKDSGVMLNITLEVARERNRRIGVMHMDYEAQYEMTTEYVDTVLKELEDVADVYRCCVPFKVPTCTSMFQSYWRPWEVEKQALWVRDLPEKYYGFLDFEFINENMYDYDFQEEFSRWIHKRTGAKRTACLVGIRTQESLNRWRAIHSDKNFRNYEGKKWTKQIDNDIFNAYPIYDWTTEDIWIANAKFSWKYNRLYDLYYMAGLGIEQMRVASPFISQAANTLSLYRVIEPHTWGKLVSRVNGVNFTGIYGGTTAMGWKSITIPEGHTWKSYMDFLLSTLPEDTRENYLSKLRTSIKFWKERGGVLSDEVIKKLDDAGVEYEVGDMTNYKTDKRPVRMEYIDDIDIPEFSEIPSYKRMCVCILKNDHLCKYMGFSLTKRETERRTAVMNKYKELL